MRWLRRQRCSCPPTRRRKAPGQQWRWSRGKNKPGKSKEQSKGKSKKGKSKKGKDKGKDKGKNKSKSKSGEVARRSPTPAREEAPPAPAAGSAGDCAPM